MMTTNLFVIANVKQLRTDGSFRVLLSFFRTSFSVGVLNSAIFNSFYNPVEFGTILEGLQNFFLGVGRFEPPTPPIRYATICECCVLSGKRLCIRLISRPEESYRLWCFWVWSLSLVNEGALTQYELSSRVSKTARVIIRVCYFVMLFPHVSAPIDHLQGGRLQRNKFELNAVKDVHYICLTTFLLRMVWN